MTRINLVPVHTLADQHLMAEWRETKHVPAALMRRLRTHSIDETLAVVPAKFCLSTGHVTFFYDKMKFLRARYTDLTLELLDRGFSLDIEGVQAFNAWFVQVPDVFKNTWIPTDVDIEVSIERIMTRISEKPEWYRHKGIPRNPEYFDSLMRTPKQEIQHA